MMASIAPAFRVVLPIVLLSGAIGGASPYREVATVQAAAGLVRYTSAAYGYSLLVPTSWMRFPGVQWTPAGPPADLTVMTPDHQAALGVIVTPTGNRRYSDAELQRVALRLLYQENGVISANPIQQKRIVINGVAFQKALGVSISGTTYTYSSQTLIGVSVTQRYNRLYALAAVVYLSEVAPPPPGPSGEPTATEGAAYRVAPGSGPGQSSRARGGTSAAVPAPASLPTAGPVTAALRSTPGSADPPQRLPTDRFRGNQCREAGDGAWIYRDKNCAARMEQQVLTAMVSSFRFMPRATADRRPAAQVGVDGFAVAANRALGVRLEYPAHWRPVSAPKTNFAARSADQNALVTLKVARIGAETLGQSDLQSVARAEIGEVFTGSAGSLNFSGPVSYQTMRVDGILYLRALAPHGVINAGSAGILQAQVSVTVASYHHRVYSLRAIALTFLGSLAANAHAPAVYPYFTPFTTLARLTQSALDLLQQQSNLAVQTTWSLFIDPSVAEG